MTGRTKTEELLARAIQMHQAGQLADAEILYQQILQADPAAADAWYLLGMLADQSGQPEVAVHYIGEALKIAPHNGHFHYNLGVILQNMDKPADAAAAYRQSLKHLPDSIQTLENLAVALADLGKDDLGEDICRKVLKLAPQSLIAHSNLGTFLLGRGQRKRALKHFDQILSRNPADAIVRSKRYQVLLSQGHFQQGYRDYAWRHHSLDFYGPSPTKLLPLPSLGVRDFANRKLVIMPEQGVGDEVLFASGLPAILSETKNALLFADRRLIPLLQRSFPTLDVRPATAAGSCVWPSGVDNTWLRCEAGDLPRMAFGDAYPVPATYLRADPYRVRFWRDQLAEFPGRHIGIAWRGGADARAQQARSISLADLAPLMDSLDASFINLQYATPGDDLATEIHDFNAIRGERSKLIELDNLDTRNDLDDLAALSVALDVVITIDSAIAHLAAAVGAKTCVLVPPNNDWRWFDAKGNAPWYTDASVWRRSPDKGWNVTLQELIEWLHAEDNTLPECGKLPEDVFAAVRASTNDTDQSAATENPGEVLLLNDTSAWYHWGCSCTSIALNEGLRANHGTVRSCALLQNLPGEILPQSADELSSDALFRRFRESYGWLIEAIENADRVIINGEGTLHGNSAQATGLLYLAWIAADRIGRPVHIVNHSVFPLDGNTIAQDITVSMYQKVYASLERPVVREPASYAVLDALGIPATLGFDCLPLFAQQHGPESTLDSELDKNIVIAGSVLVTPERIAVFADLVDNLHKDGYRISLLLGARGCPAADDAKFATELYAATLGKLDIVLATSEFDWLRQIQRASLLISGRFHHSIAAACMQTPFAVIASNTPKMTGFMLVLAELSSNPAGFVVIEEQRDLMRAAVAERLQAPAQFILDDKALESLRDLAMENFPAVMPLL